MFLSMFNVLIINAVQKAVKRLKNSLKNRVVRLG